MFKKIVAVVLVIALTAAVSIAGTMAYLTSEDSDVNVMTLGNVYIEQHEYQRAENVSHINAGAKEGDLVPFVQGQGLYPAVPKGENAYEAEQAADRCFHWGDYSPGWNGLWDDSKLANVMDKFVFVENTGKSDAYYRTLIALECPEEMTIGYNIADGDEINVNINGGARFAWDYSLGHIYVDGVRYEVWVATYTDVLKPGETSRPSLLQVVMTHNATNEDMELLGDTYEILTLSQAVQTQGFADAATALNTAFGVVTAEKAAEWFGGDEFKAPTLVDNAEDLTAAIAEGGNIVLAKDVALDANNTVTVAAGKITNLDLNGHKITSTASKTGNQELFLVKGEMTVSNGEIELKAENNQGWGAMATIFDVTAGGVLNMDGVTANVSGTDMTFVVHLNNWGEVTANISNSNLTANYVPVRVFNSGADMNNVTIKGSTLTGGRAIWVHNYTSEDFGGKLYSGSKDTYDVDKVDARLNLDIFGNGNVLNGEKGAVRYGMTNSFHLDANGNLIP